MWSQASSLSPKVYAGLPESEIPLLAVGALQWVVYVAVKDGCRTASYLGSAWGLEIGSKLHSIHSP